MHVFYFNLCVILGMHMLTFATQGKQNIYFANIQNNVLYILCSIDYDTVAYLIYFQIYFYGDCIIKFAVSLIESNMHFSH